MPQEKSIILVKFNEEGRCVCWHKFTDLSNEVLNRYIDEHNYYQVDEIKDYYLDNGVVKIIPPKPEGDSYAFNYTTHEWEINSVSLISSIRKKRTKLLSDSDYIELPSIQFTLTDEKKLEWSTYRQALRDITEQTDLLNIVWPTKP